MSFIGQWFGFNGWKELSTRGSIFATIFYRIFFVVGLAASIITYSYVSGGEDPSTIWILIVGLIWFLMFQFLINLIFVNGSR
jgi:ABC-type bacteriocin/lantibiotic exporter with double-glycine peptidase domain